MVNIFRSVAANAAVNTPVFINGADPLFALPTQASQSLFACDPFALVFGNPAALRKENRGKAALSIYG